MKRPNIGLCYLSGERAVSFLSRRRTANQLEMVTRAERLMSYPTPVQYSYNQGLWMVRGDQGLWMVRGCRLDKPQVAR